VASNTACRFAEVFKPGVPLPPREFFDHPLHKTKIILQQVLRQNWLQKVVFAAGDRRFRGILSPVATLMIVQDQKT
jgi:hypothetical protein